MDDKEKVNNGKMKPKKINIPGSLANPWRWEGLLFSAK